jgi:hypothetical protein
MRSISTALFLVLLFSDHRNSLAERHLSPAELNERLLSLAPRQTGIIKKKISQGRDRRRSSLAVFRRVLSFSKSKTTGPNPGTVSAWTTATNVVATICPYGMLPLGKQEQSLNLVLPSQTNLVLLMPQMYIPTLCCQKKQPSEWRLPVLQDNTSWRVLSS